MFSFCSESVAHAADGKLVGVGTVQTCAKVSEVIEVKCSIGRATHLSATPVETTVAYTIPATATPMASPRQKYVVVLRGFRGLRRDTDIESILL